MPLHHLLTNTSQNLSQLGCQRLLQIPPPLPYLQPDFNTHLPPTLPYLQSDFNTHLPPPLPKLQPDINRHLPLQSRIFVSDVQRAVDTLRDNVEVFGEEIDEIEMEPSEATEILPRTGDEHKNNVREFPSSEEPAGYNGQSSLPYSSRPMEKYNMLHIAGWNVKDGIVDDVAEHAPNLLFSFNKNKDSPLHVAARAGNISTVEKLLAAYANFERGEIAEAWKEYYRSLLENNQPMLPSLISLGDLLELVDKENDQGNTMLHEAMICGKGSIGFGAKVLKAVEPYIIKNYYQLPGWSSLDEVFSEYALLQTNRAKQSVLYLAVEAADKEAVELILNKCPDTLKKPEGISQGGEKVMIDHLIVKRRMIIMQHASLCFHSIDSKKKNGG